MKVIGISPSRTGTTSLAMAVARLGYSNTFHTTQIAKSISVARTLYKASQKDKIPFDLLNRFDAIIDLPVSLFPSQTYEMWPSARYVYLERDPMDWYRSASEAIPLMIEYAQRLPHPGIEYFTMFLVETFLSEESIVPIKNKNRAIDWMIRQRLEVESVVPSAQLLTFDIKYGWEPLCKFLATKQVDGNFPHVNKRSEIAAWIRTQ